MVRGSVALVLLVALPAAADPSTCPRPTGAIVFEIDQRVEHGAKLDTSTTMHGAWRSDKLDRDSRHVLDQVAYEVHVPALADAVTQPGERPRRRAGGRECRSHAGCR